MIYPFLKVYTALTARSTQTRSAMYLKNKKLLKAHKTLAFAGIFTELTLLRFLLNF